MEIKLGTKLQVIGYSQLFGVHHSRIKARSKEINTSVHFDVLDQIRATEGSYTSEYRIVKEPKGYIFREVLSDSGINGHHKTMKRCIVGALRFVTIHLDEEFERAHLEYFKKKKRQHLAREKNCKHHRAYNYKNWSIHCPDCGTSFDIEDKSFNLEKLNFTKTPID